MYKISNKYSLPISLKIAYIIYIEQNGAKKMFTIGQKVFNAALNLEGQVSEIFSDIDPANPWIWISHDKGSSSSVWSVISQEWQSL
jgi:hypothetical protein